MKKQLYLRLKYGAYLARTDYKLFKLDQDYILYKNYSISKKGTLKELKDFLRKQYKNYYKKLQKDIAHLIGSPYLSKCQIPNLVRYL